jgi:hypothetical protein
MILNYNRSLSLKYLLNLHLTSNFLNEDSIAFELVRYTIENQSDPLSIDIDNLKFTSKTLKYIFGDKTKSEDFKNFMVDSIKSLIKKDLIKPNGSSMYITNNLLYKFYSIKE